MPFDVLKRLLTATESEPAAPEDARAAIAAVLVMAARADDHYANEEKRIIDSVLVERFKVTPEEAIKLREEGEEAEAEAIDHYQFTKAIKQAVPHDDRVKVLEGLWRVILADDQRDAHEDALMRQLVDRLGLAPMDSVRARNAAAADQG